MYAADGLYLIDGEFPVWMLIALVGAFLSGIVYCSTINEHRPLYHFVRINSTILLHQSNMYKQNTVELSVILKSTFMLYY